MLQKNNTHSSCAPCRTNHTWLEREVEEESGREAELGSR